MVRPTSSAGSGGVCFVVGVSCCGQSGKTVTSLISLLFVCGCFSLDFPGCFCVKGLVDSSMFTISAIISLTEGVREAVLPMSDASLMMSLLSHSNMGDKSLKRESVDSRLPARAVLFARFGI